MPSSCSSHEVIVHFPHAIDRPFYLVSSIAQHEEYNVAIHLVDVQMGFTGSNTVVFSPSRKVGMAGILFDVFFLKKTLLCMGMV
jgi:hypothetical protein